MDIPKWFDDPEAPWPCPCGLSPFGKMVIIETESGSKIMAHQACIEFFEKYMEEND